jgi:hypothetical protein
VLTEAGYDKVVAIAPGHAETVRQLVFEALTPVQMRQLDRLCEALLVRQEALGRQPPGTPPGT